jgi:hypothetical protein
MSPSVLKNHLKNIYLIHLGLKKKLLKKKIKIKFFSKKFKKEVF